MTPKRPSVRISGARLVAYDVLRDVEERDAYANLALPVKVRAAKLDRRDAGLAVELASGTLRGRARYDRIIELAANRTTDEIDGRTLNVLRLGVHQLMSMRVPKHAVLHETVELQRKVASERAVGFVNGVLRTVSRTSAEGWDKQITSEAKSDDERLAVVNSHPEWIVRAFRAALAAEGRSGELSELLNANNVPPKVSLAVLDADASALAHRSISDDEYTVHDTGPSPLGLELQGGDPMLAIAALGAESGTVRVQDQGSQLVALAFARAPRKHRTVPPAHERWLDLCAGPGGKTAILGFEAERIGAVVRANEVSAHRARLVEDATASVSDAVEIVSHDGRSDAAYGSSDAQFERILIDAPCSGIGSLRRRPEARWRKQPSDLPELTTLQSQLLEAAAERVAIGGIIGYVVCSSHLAETQVIVSRFAKRHPEFTELDARSILNSVARTPLDFGTAEGLSAQLWPHRHGTDAMFLALFEKSRA